MGALTWAIGAGDGCRSQRLSYLHRGLLLMVGPCSREQPRVQFIQGELDTEIKLFILNSDGSKRGDELPTPWDFSMPSLLVYEIVDDTVRLEAVQRTLWKAPQSPAFLLWSVILTRHSFHLALFPKYVYANIQGTQQVSLSNWQLADSIHTCAFVFSFLSALEQEAPLWEDEGGAEAEAEGKSHKGRVWPGCRCGV